MTQPINKSVGWTPMKPMHIGDIFTMPGQYKRRTFWQWLKNNPKELQKFVVKNTCSSYSTYEPHNG